MTFQEVMTELQALGSEQTKRTFLKHGAIEPFFGVKVGDMKKMLKKIKKNHALALELYASGNADAMYFAALIAEPQLFTKDILQTWVQKATWQMLTEYSVAWMAAESPHGWELGNEWIHADNDLMASAGWATLSYWVALTDDNSLDFKTLQNLLDFIQQNIHTKKNRTRYTMNGFVMAVGTHIIDLHNQAKAVATAIGQVKVDMNGTACQVPDAFLFLQKMANTDKVGKKRKTVVC
jgi:3-methyladenine DNA glycosylase AlkD